MAPPAKRQKRHAVPDDEDEEERPQANTLTKFLFSSPNSKTQSSPVTSPISSKIQSRPSASQVSTTASGHLTNRSLRSKDAARSPSTSPEKARNRGQKKIGLEEKGKSGDLLALFSKQAEKVQKNGRNDGAANGPESDYLISDPISDDDDVGEHRATTASSVGQNARKRLRDSSQATTQAITSSSQMFVKPQRPARPTSLDDDLRPWSERFAPLNMDELAVHKKKVADVRKWLEDVMKARMRQRLLILKGAAGTGKTTTVRLLAREMNCELLEWRNPTGALGAAFGLQSQSAQFQEFMGRGGKFGQLDTGTIDIPAPAKGKEAACNSLRKIILIEEFPNTFTRGSSALTSFRNTVMAYLAANTPSLATFGYQTSKEPVVPIIMIVSETLLTTTSASADSFTAHRLLGPEILRHPGTGVIEFNAIAPSLLLKALELVVQKEARKSGRRRTPGPLVLRRLGEIGDIRSAVSSLEFLCLKGDQEADWGAKVTFTKPKKSAKDGIAMTQGEQESLELISQREASLGIFHAVGKVVYNKREERPPPNDTVESLPDYAAHHSRPKRSQVSVDTLIDETGTDTHTFVSALHENYILSCEQTGPSDPSSTLDYINGCIEYLSESDLLCPSWDVFFGKGDFRGSFAGRDSGSHVLRQDEMTFQVAVRGMLFSLPSPVKRQTSGSGRGAADAFKMFYPTSVKLWKTKEELEGLVDVWSSRLLRGEDVIPRKDLTDGAAVFRRPPQGSVGTWATNQQQYKPSTPMSSGQGQSDATPLLSLGSAARKEMIMERLPYMAHIGRSRRSLFQCMRIKDIERVVSFEGIGPQSEDSSDERDDNLATGEAWATDKPSEESSPRKKGATIRNRSDGSLLSGPVQRLVLSDDDIEDD